MRCSRPIFVLVPLCFSMLDLLIVLCSYSYHIPAHLPLPSHAYCLSAHHTNSVVQPNSRNWHEGQP